MPPGGGARPVARRGPLTDAPAQLPSAPDTCKAPARPHTGQEGPAPPTRARAPEAPASMAAGLSVEPHLFGGRGGASAIAGPAWLVESHGRAPWTPPLTPSLWHTRAAVGGSGPGSGALNNVPAALPRCLQHDALWLLSSRTNWTSALAHTARKECAPGPAPTSHSAVSPLTQAQTQAPRTARAPPRSSRYAGTEKAPTHPTRAAAQSTSVTLSE